MDEPRQRRGFVHPTSPTKDSSAHSEYSSVLRLGCWWGMRISKNEKEVGNVGEELIVTLDVCEGNAPGKPVAFYGQGRRSSIVFMPKSAPVGQKVRVRLVALTNPDGTPKEDRGGKPMYEARPAPDEVVEQWLEENGQIVKFEVTLDWQHPFDSSKVVDPSIAKATSVLEHRAIAERLASPITRSTPALVLGTDWASSTLEVTTTETIPIEAEAAVNGQRAWKKVREEPGSVTATPNDIKSWSVVSGTWQSNRLTPVYDPSWSLTIRAKYQSSQGWETSHDHTTTWGELPVWLQQELTAQYALCTCGRQRIDPAQAAGYAHCETCRTKAACDQCGKVTGKVTPVGTRVVCDGCQPYVAAENLLMVHLTTAHRQQLADEATRLLGGDHYDREAGEVLLRATADHLTDESRRKTFLEKWSGFDHYYFTSEGIFGSKLAPAALAILRHLPSATGNGLVELVAWTVTVSHKFTSVSDRERDFYTRIQVDGKSAATVPFSEAEVKRLTDNLDKDEKQLSAWLRGTEADRQALLAARTELSEKVRRQVDEILQSDRQEYAMGRTVITEGKEARQRELTQPRYQPTSKPAPKPQRQPSAPPPRPTSPLPPAANLDGLSADEKFKALQEKFRRD